MQEKSQAHLIPIGGQQVQASTLSSGTSAVLRQALDGLIAMADVMHRSEISTVPSARFTAWKQSVLTLSAQLDVPQFVVFREVPTTPIKE